MYFPIYPPETKEEMERGRKKRLHNLALERLPMYTELHKTATMANDKELQEIARAKLLEHLANIME
ncbi:hypothetical protein [Acinetobacter baumannii]|uniref:hypothetical protein n=1 Tax=Acinetobacter baumannii TaxID=470 RepID=UPI00244BB59F|nr:hypothetical protein [Acinetobacter baumannii]MDH2523288.1 hypothetical protein [Acinetobacter baumannii]